MEKEFVGKMRARVAALRYRNPARAVRIIAVAGASGKTTTALLLNELLLESGSKVLALTNHGCFLNGQPLDRRYDNSSGAVQRSLALAKSKQADFVIIEVTDAFIQTHVLPTLNIEMSIITNDSPSAQTLLNQPVNYTVVPSGFDVAGLGVVPHQAISFGEDETAEAQMSGVILRRRGTEIDLVIDHQTKLSIATYLIGMANARNATTAVSAAYVLAADLSAVEEGVARLERVAGNYDYIQTASEARPYDVAVDGASTVESLELLLSSAHQLKKRRLLVALDASVPLLAEKDMKQLTDRVVVVNAGEGLTGLETAGSLQEAFDLVLRGAKKDDLVLLVGREFAALEPGGLTKAHRMLEATDE
ncbi:MAG TPA: Mur ligase family protein [Candidatus Saccharibacteria bacterium]|nr:Mur ligase family protein [Candidatus Saccharibacteria bacterium]HRK94029.1 Mur ligase family protein [Candidatus Saccharibacteria bacterium]